MELPGVEFKMRGDVMPTNFDSFGKLIKLSTCCLVLVLAFANYGRADVVYSYVGNNFTQIDDYSPPGGSYDTSMSVNGSMTLANALAPNLVSQQIAPNVFVFSDGRNTFSQSSNLGVEQFFVSTNSQGDIVNWYIHLQQPTSLDPFRTIQSFNDFGLFTDMGSIFPQGGSADSGRVDNNPGAWTTTVVPEPSACVLVSLAMGLLMFRRRDSRAR